MNVTGAQEIDYCVKNLCWKWEQKNNVILLSRSSGRSVASSLEIQENPKPFASRYTLLSTHVQPAQTPNEVQCFWHVYSSLIALVTEA